MVSGLVNPVNVIHVLPSRERENVFYVYTHTHKHTDGESELEIVWHFAFRENKIERTNVRGICIYLCIYIYIHMYIHMYVYLSLRRLVRRLRLLFFYSCLTLANCQASLHLRDKEFTLSRRKIFSVVFGWLETTSVSRRKATRRTSASCDVFLARSCIYHVMNPLRKIGQAIRKTEIPHMYHTLSRCPRAEMPGISGHGSEFARRVK